MKHLEGIVPACVTPFNGDYSVNYDGVKPLVDHFANAGVSGLFVNGSSAEFLTLKDTERQDLAEAYVDASSGQLPVIVHVGANELSSAVKLAKHAQRIGADAIGTLPPLDRKNSTADGDFEWYRSVGETSNLPLYVYLRSDMGSSEIRPEEFLDRMSTIPTFAGIKYGASNFHIAQGIKQQAKAKPNILTGPDELLLAGLVMGSDGAIGTTYNAFPNHAVAIYRNHKEGNIRKAEELQGQLGELIGELIRMGVVLAGTKAIMREQGLDVGQCRPSAKFGMAQAAHTEKVFTDRATDSQVAALMRIVRKYNLQ